MARINEIVRSMSSDEDGATMVEYGMMVALIAAVCVAIVATIGGQIQTAFTNASTGI